MNAKQTSYKNKSLHKIDYKYLLQELKKFNNPLLKYG